MNGVFITDSEQNDAKSPTFFIQAMKSLALKPYSVIFD